MSTQHMYADSAGGAREITTAPPNAAADPTTTTSASASDGAAAGAASGPAESADIRITTHYQYTSPHFTPNDFVADPLEQFKQWFAEASPKVREPEGMCVSSVSPDGFPSSRMVLLRGVDARGWTFYTNYGSRKSRELAAGTGTGTDGADGGKVAVCWYWKETSRQIRAVGVVEKVSREDSEKYFASRPRGSQIGAWASEQSKVIREGELEERVKALEKEWEGKDVVCPEHWGGWRIVPSEVEFWAGHSSRLHDRFRYLRQADGSWSLDRLAP